MYQMIIKVIILIISFNKSIKCQIDVPPSVIDDLVKDNIDEVSNLFKSGEDIQFSAFGNAGPTNNVKPTISISDDSPIGLLSEFSVPRMEAFGLSKIATLSERVSKVIAKRFNLPKSEVANTLRQLSIKDSFFENMCENPEQLQCTDSKYRTIDGSCNNLQFPTQGQALTAFKRYLDPDYADGIDLPREGQRGQKLPSPRFASIRLHNDIDIPSSKITNMFMQWGQFLDHDIAQTAGTLRNGAGIDCCNTVDEACLPIFLEKNDPYFAQFRRQCMSFSRSLPMLKVGCQFGPREQMNQVTSYIDASNVYGSSHSLARNLKTFIKGKLMTISLNGNHKDILPNDGGTVQQCSLPLPTSTERQSCAFQAGDVRSNLIPTLAALHTIWLRAHNSIVEELLSLNPHWNDETLYQESRRIIGAMMQRITYTEFLPLVLGRSMQNYKLTLLNNGYFNDYNKNKDATIANGFATAAFRFGHSTIQPVLEKIDNKRIPKSSVLLENVFFKAFDLYKPGGVDEYLRGLMNQTIQKPDEFVTDQVTNHLFQTGPEIPAFDLVSINIQRGRDHGIPSYNFWRSFCNLQTAVKFEDLNKWMYPRASEKFSNIYNDVWDIDLFSGGLYERPITNALVGPTFACIIGKQFEDLRLGDRYWHENSGPHAFTKDQLQEIRKITLAAVICAHSDDIVSVQKKVMLKPNRNNPEVQCSQMPFINLRPWAEQRRQG